jgi:hypothetical protein
MHITSRLCNRMHKAFGAHRRRSPLTCACPTRRGTDVVPVGVEFQAGLRTGARVVPKLLSKPEIRRLNSEENGVSSDVQI